MKKVGKKGRKKEPEVTPIMEPVIPPTSETDPWLVPEGAPAPEPEISPELPPTLAAELFDEPLPPSPTSTPPHHRRTLMWVGVAVCMVVIFGGWAWSLRYSLLLPSQPASESALSDALEQFRSQTATFGQDLSEIKAGLAAINSSKETISVPSQDEVIKTLKEKVTEEVSQ